MTKKATTPTSDGMRRCIGSKTFGIEPHEAPVADFPTQPSQKDGLGRMCKPHWRQYTNALRKAKVAREGEAVRAHNEAMESRTTPAPGSLDAGEAAVIAGAVDGAIAREVKRRRRGKAASTEADAE
jgi:hypothetical protein